MDGESKISDINVMLKAVRVQIEVLHKTIESKPYDKELRKLLREARSEESVLLAELKEWTLN